MTTALGLVAFVVSLATLGDLPASLGVRELRLVRRDAERLDESALLAKWGEPREWPRLLTLERY